jgi:hypothetical protein
VKSEATTTVNTVVKRKKSGRILQVCRARERERERDREKEREREREREFGVPGDFAVVDDE